MRRRISSCGLAIEVTFAVFLALKKEWPQGHALHATGTFKIHSSVRNIIRSWFCLPAGRISGNLWQSLEEIYHYMIEEVNNEE